MSRFTSHLGIRSVGKRWVLTEPLIWEVRIGDNLTDTITIPAGFKTDLGSIPWYARLWLNSADPRAARAYVLHDFVLKHYGPAHQMFAATQFHEALKALGVKYRKLQVLGVVLAIDRW